LILVAPRAGLEPATIRLTSDPIADLVAERERLEKERAHLNAACAGSATAEAQLVEISREEATLNAEEAEAWRKWAEAPHGDPPEVDRARREDIDRRKILAARDHGTALRAARALEPALTHVSGQLASIASRLFEARLQAVMADVRSLHAQTHDHAAALSAATARLYGFDRTLIELQGAASGEVRANLQNARTEFDALKQPALTATPAAIEAHGTEWRRRLQGEH
jgi:hypothetical protein